MSAADEVTFPRGSEALRGHLSRAQPAAERGAIVLIPDVYTRADAYRPEAAAGAFERAVGFFEAHSSGGR